MKKIIQSFWSKPMSKDRFIKSLWIAALSLAFARRSGYEITMYTDTKGAEILKQLPYKEVNTKLDKMPNIKHPDKLFACGKYFALKDNPVGTVHIDLDVMLKKPCLDSFFNGEGDVVIQNRENGENADTYSKINTYFKGIKYPKNININPKHNFVYNVGTIGFNNKDLLDKYLSNYKEAIDIFKNYDLKMAVDFVLELQYIYQLCEENNASVNTIINVTSELDRGDVANIRDVNNRADEVGYCHLLGGMKWHDYFIESIKDKLKTLDEDIYKKINNYVEQQLS